MIQSQSQSLMWFAIAVVLLGLVFITSCGYTDEKTEHMTPNPIKQSSWIPKQNNYSNIFKNPLKERIGR